MERRVNGDMAEPHLPVGQGVQIRFIDNLKEEHKPKRGRSKQESYGVAIRVQGIDGQPFVVLNSGDKAKSSYGVQIKTDHSYGNASPNPPLPDYQGIATKASPTVRSISSDLELPENPYETKSYRAASLHYSSTSDEEQNAKPRSKPRALQPTQKEELRRSQSQGSLVDHELEDSYGYDGHYSERSSTLDTTYSQSSSSRGSLKKLDNGDCPTRSGFKPATSQQPTSFFSRSSQQRKDVSSPSSPKLPSEDIDTKPLSSVDSLITKFDSKPPGRGRPGQRSQALIENRKRSQSLDGRKSFQNSTDSREVLTLPPVSQPFTRQTLEREDVNKTRLTKEWLDQTMQVPVGQRTQTTAQAEMPVISTTCFL